MIDKRIDHEFKKAVSNYHKGVYSLDKAIGHIAGTMSTAYAFLKDELIIQLGSETINGLRDHARNK